MLCTIVQLIAMRLEGHFQKLFLNKVFIRIKIARKFKFYLKIIISGSKSVKKGQKMLKKATN